MRFERERSRLAACPPPPAGAPRVLESVGSSEAKKASVFKRRTSAVEPLQRRNRPKGPDLKALTLGRAGFVWAPDLRPLLELVPWSREQSPRRPPLIAPRGMKGGIWGRLAVQAPAAHFSSLSLSFSEYKMKKMGPPEGILRIPWMNLGEGGGQGARAGVSCSPPPRQTLRKSPSRGWGATASEQLPIREGPSERGKQEWHLLCKGVKGI